MDQTIAYMTPAQFCLPFLQAILLTSTTKIDFFLRLKKERYLSFQCHFSTGSASDSNTIILRYLEMLHSAAWTKGGGKEEEERNTNKTKAACSHTSKWGILITLPGQGYVQQPEQPSSFSPNHVQNCSKPAEHPVMGNTNQTGLCTEPEQQHDPSRNHVHSCSKSPEHPVLGNTKQTRLCTEPEQQCDPSLNHVHNCSKPAEHPVTGNTNQTRLCTAVLTAKQTQP